MSNPGIIVLKKADIASNTVLYKNRLQIEDNIGEAIHVHYKNTRFDFTINEFLAISDFLMDSLCTLFNSCDVDLRLISPELLFDARKHLYNIKSTSIEHRYLDDLCCIVYKEGRGSPFKYRKPIDTPAYRYLTRQSTDFLHYQQNGTPTFNNDLRLSELMKSIKVNGYPHKNCYITIFDSTEIVRDGQHRVAVLRALYGNISIPVLNITFDNQYRKHRVSQRLRLLRQIRWIVKKNAKRIYRKLQSIKSK